MTVPNHVLVHLEILILFQHDYSCTNVKTIGGVMLLFSYWFTFIFKLKVGVVCTCSPFVELIIWIDDFLNLLKTILKFRGISSCYNDFSAAWISSLNSFWK